MLQLEHTCAVSRSVKLGTNGRYAMQTLATGVSCLALPMSAQASRQNGFDIGRAFDFYFDQAQDIKVGDKLTKDGLDYTVSGRQLYDVPLVGHLHVTASQEVGS